MSNVAVSTIFNVEVDKILALEEGHFSDLKAKEIKPGKLTRTLSAFSNAEGGELYIGIDEDQRSGERAWRGFDNPESANGFIQIFEELFPLGQEYSYDFLSSEECEGLVLKVEVHKTRAIKQASDEKVYVRRSASNIPIETNEALERLRRNKGITSFETEVVNTDKDFITNSEIVIGFMLQVVPESEPETWLEKQQLLINDKPTVAGTILFADEPQALLAKRCGIKIYRYKTSNDTGSREQLDFDPISIEGSAYDQIYETVKRTSRIVESVQVSTPQGLEKVNYPERALHEIITNAVLHRDYSVADDIHIKIFDNRIDVTSPGTLPGHITPHNILRERFSRNGIVVRLINKFPNPPNKDVGEGLNTAFSSMRDMKLKEPTIEQDEASVTVTLRHEPLASPQEMIIEYLQHHPTIANKTAREICFIGSENRMKRIFQKMIEQGEIEMVPGRNRYTAAYKLKE